MKDRAGRVGNPEIHIPYEVIRTLGRIATLGILGTFVLVLLVVLSNNAIDAVTATLITGFMGLGGSAAVALGAILATTGKGSPQPVSVVNPPTDPIPTTESTPAAVSIPALPTQDVMEDPTGADPGVLDPAP